MSFSKFIIALKFLFVWFCLIYRYFGFFYFSIFARLWVHCSWAHIYMFCVCRLTCVEAHVHMNKSLGSTEVIPRCFSAAFIKVGLLSKLRAPCCGQSPQPACCADSLPLPSEDGIASSPSLSLCLHTGSGDLCISYGCTTSPLITELFLQANNLILSG